MVETLRKVMKDASFLIMFYLFRFFRRRFLAQPDKSVPLKDPIMARVLALLGAAAVATLVTWQTSFEQALLDLKWHTSRNCKIFQDFTIFTKFYKKSFEKVK